MTDLLLVNNFVSSSKVEERDELSYTVRSLVMVREPVAKRKRLNSRYDLNLLERLSASLRWICSTMRRDTTRDILSLS